MSYYVMNFILLSLTLIGQTLAMSTCSEKVGSILLMNEKVEGSFLEHLASKTSWACLGVDPDKDGFTSILLESEDLAINELGETYLYLTITRTFSNMTSRSFGVKWTQHEGDRFFDAEYPDGQYYIYHFYYKGLIVFHRCSVACVENGNVSITVFAPINLPAEEISKTVAELRESLQKKFPSAEFVDLDYPLITSVSA